MGLPSYETWHWRIYNVLRRVFGIGAVLNGTILALWNLLSLVSPRWATDLAGEPLPSTWTLAGAVLMSLVFIGLGLVLVHSRTYRPDLGDSHWLAAPQQARMESRAGRNWWTGDRKGGSTRAAV
jgi:hypothetical protein